MTEILSFAELSIVKTSGELSKVFSGGSQVVSNNWYGLLCHVGDGRHIRRPVTNTLHSRPLHLYHLG